MKRLFSCLVVFVFACILAFMLVGCGADHRPNFTGDWHAISLSSADGTDHTESVERIAAANKYITLTLSDDDDKAYMDMAGQADLQGSWKPTGEDSCVISFEGYDDLHATLSDDGILTVDENGQSMVCERAGNQAGEEPSVDGASNQDQDAQQQ